MRVIGPGRAGTSLMGALAAVGWRVEPPLERGDDLTAAADGVSLLVITTPDAAIADVAAAVRPEPDTVVAHMAGSLGLDVLGHHVQRAAIHPLVPLPDADLGAQRLGTGAWFALAADPPEALAFLRMAVDDLGGRSFTVADEDRASYHAAAVIASNHLVALFAQVERVAAGVGVPREAYLHLARVTLENVEQLGSTAALTGPAARGDWDTIERHRAVLPADEVELYDAMVRAARRLVEDR